MQITLGCEWPRNKNVSRICANNLFKEIHMNTGVGKQNATATAEKTSELQKTLDQETLDNLSTAMHGEAFAHVKYLLYAEHARKNGHKELI